MDASPASKQRRPNADSESTGRLAQGLADQRRVSVNDEFGRMLDLFMTKQATEKGPTQTASSRKKSRRTAECMEQELEQNSDYTVATGKRKVDNRGSIRGRADARSSSLALPRPEQQSAKTAHDAMWTPGQFILLTHLHQDVAYPCLLRFMSGVHRVR